MSGSTIKYLGAGAGVILFALVCFFVVIGGKEKGVLKNSQNAPVAVQKEKKQTEESEKKQEEMKQPEEKSDEPVTLLGNFKKTQDFSGMIVGMADDQQGKILNIQATLPDTTKISEETIAKGGSLPTVNKIIAVHIAEDTKLTDIRAEDLKAGDLVYVKIGKSIFEVIDTEKALEVQVVRKAE